MLTANLSGYPKRPDLEIIRKYLDVGGENPFTMSTKMAIRAQIEAKIDIITDGQIRDPLTLIASNVPGMEIDGRVTIESKLGMPLRPVVVADFQIAAECSDPRRVKAVLPGPFSFAKSCRTSSQSPYRSNFDTDLLFDIASIIRFEIDKLRESKARLIQIIEPIESIHDIDTFLDLTSFTLKRVRTPICHLDGDLCAVFPKLLEAKISVISCDVIAYPQNRGILQFHELFEVHEKTLSLGCVDASTQKDSVESIERRVIDFVNAFGPDSIWISPNNTLANLSSDTAFRKLKQLTAVKNRIAAKMA